MCEEIATIGSQNNLASLSDARRGMFSPTYDNNGNTTTDDAGTTYKYDAWNRLVTVTLSGAGSAAEAFQYTAIGARASVNANLCSSTTSYSFFSSDWQDVEDDVYNSGSYNKSTQVWGLGYVDDLVERDDSGGTRLYAQQDAGWNVTALVSTAGTVVERFIYDPYGVATVLTSTWGSGSDSYNWVYRWKGGRYDGTSGLYNFRNRDYSPTLGRWMDNDPAGYVDGANLYQAMLGAPIDTVDPLGLEGSSGSGSGVYNKDSLGTLGHAGEPPASEMNGYVLPKGSIVHERKDGKLKYVYDEHGVQTLYEDSRSADGHTRHLVVLDNGKIMRVGRNRGKHWEQEVPDWQIGPVNANRLRQEWGVSGSAMPSETNEDVDARYRQRQAAILQHYAPELAELIPEQVGIATTSGVTGVVVAFLEGGFIGLAAGLAVEGLGAYLDFKKFDELTKAMEEENEAIKQARDRELRNIGITPEERLQR